ncbi:hypothetical protein HG530_011856 [Fusarium avenaceum]|nr:hypothetical protein HG530_011856 [Fusarium avenaceum]
MSFIRATGDLTSRGRYASFGLEEICGKVATALQSVCLLEQMELDIESGVGLAGDRLRLDTLQLETSKVLLRVNSKHYLCQRWDILVRKRSCSGRSDLAHQTLKCIRLVNGDAHTLRVDKETNHVLQLPAVTVCNGDADHGVVNGCETVMRRAESSEQDGEGSAVVLVAEAP